MSRLRTALRILLLALAGLLAVASSEWPEPENDFRTDETWMVANVWDGQTAVPTDLVIELNVGRQDFQFDSQADGVIREVVLRLAPDGPDVQVNLDIGLASTLVVPLGGLEPDTDYELDLGGLEGQLYSTRGFPPGPIRFSTRFAPRVVELYRSENAEGQTSLIVLFSEPMRAQTMFLSQQSVDVLWEEGGELKSVAADHNLARYVWNTDGHLFLLAPFDFQHPVWLKITHLVEGMSGVGLDGDLDGTGGTAADDWVTEVTWPSPLPICYARSDIPQPCIEQSLIPEFAETWW